MNSFSKSALIKEAWEMFKKNLNSFMLLIGVYLVYYVAQYASNMIFQDSGIAFIVSLVFLVVSLVIQLGAYNFVLKIVDGKKAQLVDLYSYPDMVMKIVRNIVAGIIVAFAVGLGFILFIIPGIYLLVRLMFFTYYIVDKNAGIMESIQMSWNLTKGSVVNLFLLGVIFLFINFLGALVFGIGLAVTLPLTFLATALLYRKYQK